MSKKAALFAIDGTDGSGKSMHVKMLHDCLKEQGHQVELFDFPQYGQPSAKLIEMYLNREFGDTIDALDPYQAATCYAFDRQIATPKIRAAQAEGKIPLCNRYQMSSKAHQGSKIRDKNQRLHYYRWLDQLEFDMLGIVRPMQTFFLRMPTKQAQQFTSQKAPRAHLTGADLHESNLDHLLAAADCYVELCELFPDDYTLIECTDEHGELEDLPTINRKIQAQLLPLLERS